MIDFINRIKQLNEQYNACSCCRSFLGIKFALCQLMFEFDSVITSLRTATKDAPYYIFEYDTDDLKKLRDTLKWNNLIGYNSWKTEKQDMDGVINGIADLFKESDNEGKFFNEFRTVAASCASTSSDFVYMLEKCVQKAVGLLFDEVDRFVDADAGEKCPEAYEKFYDDVQYSMMDQRDVGINISTWKSEVCDLTVGDIRLKLLEEIMKFCDYKCLVIKSPVRPEQREAAREYLKSLGASDDEANRYTDSYAKLSRFTLRNRDFLFTFDHAGIGKYLASHKKEVDSQKRTYIKVFEALVNELIKAYQQLVPVEEEKSLLEKIKEDLKPVHEHLSEQWNVTKFERFWDKLNEDPFVQKKLQKISPAGNQFGYNLKFVIAIITWMHSTQKNPIIKSSKTTLNKILYGKETHISYFNLSKNTLEGCEQTVKKIIAEINEL